MTFRPISMMMITISTRRQYGSSSPPGPNNGKEKEDQEKPRDGLSGAATSAHVTGSTSSSETPPSTTSPSSSSSSSSPPHTSTPHSADPPTPKSATHFVQSAQQMMEERLKQVVTDINLGDQLSVVGIALLTVLIISAPVVIRHMKQSPVQDYSHSMISDDPVDEFIKLARQEWSDDEDSTKSKNPLEAMLRDVMQSQALQQATQQFVLQILQAPAVREALLRLLKELWADLVNDPETVAQVIHLLQVAIQDEKIKRAAQELVIELVQDEAVKKALLRMLQEVVREPEVRQATQRLLTQSAHATLNDAEILDHSMEFATDVLGDDIVQRTAGEALRNTVRHAFLPASTVLLTAMGVGLLIFSVMAIGYARSSEQEAVLLATVARSLQSRAATGIVRIWTWPWRALQAGWYHLRNDVLWPSHPPGARSLPSSMGHSISGWLSYAASAVWQGVFSLVTTVATWGLRAGQATCRAVGHALGRSLTRVGQVLWNVLHATGQGLYSLMQSMGQFLGHGLVRLGFMLAEGSQRTWQRTRHGLTSTWNRFWTTLEQVWFDLVSKVFGLS